ncbi:MAG: hypothetical protein WCJ40_09315 [Planctomycetota bacterium]
MQMQSANIDENIRRAVQFVHDKANARATGIWMHENDVLHLELFLPSRQIQECIAGGFAEATAKVPVTDTGLGIVLAARARQITEYRAVDLPPESGSGYWLRAFRADRSVAVPFFDKNGDLKRILSVAVVGLEIPTQTYSSIIQEAFQLYLKSCNE